ncbi:MAG TPA: alanine--tRNA ligase [Flavitalea sp.]|nr:alanine--tRNA ligase [Flavitalea sp.]
MMTSAAIRQHFLAFFQSKQHLIVPSAPIVVKNDPTLLFTNAGMNQFKDYFLGNAKPQSKRIADTQKCLRVSGKHNDLEEVGVDTYHHTMFEMLGNWSFGDYFKKEAIQWSWELLTSVYKISPDRLYVTVFEGDENEKLPKDEEAISEWKKWIEPSRIINGNKKDNFWEMGDTGPCGPCTEIHVDCRPENERQITTGASLVNKDHPQVIEIWNNVFIQFNRLKDGSLEPLPDKHVDTGMGLERLVRVLQNKSSNYDTDIFTGTIRTTASITGKSYTGDDSRESIAFRVLADHIRAICFTIADGQLPSNTGAGYVIRRILRRAVRYYYTYLGYQQPLLFQLVPKLKEQFAEVFPELKHQETFVAKVVREEEEAFLRTLDKGLKKIDDLIAESIKTKSNSIKGSAAFELFDTYGFPIDLTKLIAAEKNLSVDEGGFETEMAQQKQRSRSASIVNTEDWIMLEENSGTRFVGYDQFESDARITRYRKVSSKGKESFQLVLDKTPFYAESGGQVGDTGILEFGSEQVTVTDTRKENELITHFIQGLPAKIDQRVIAKVDIEKRIRTAGHHTATHLLHAALRKVLGPHVSQKGSLVNEEYLRFDFAHFAKLSDEEIKKIESLINEKIRLNIPVVTQQMKKDEALKLGAMALFGEKYGDQVRVVMIDPAYSVELCGGTHARETGELGFFKITQETAVAAGVRRIEAVSGRSAEIFISGQLDLLDQVKERLKNPKNLTVAIDTLLQESSQLKKKIESFENKLLSNLKNELFEKKERLDGIFFIGEIVEVSSADALRKLYFDLKTSLADHLVVLCASIESKAAVLVGTSETVAASRNFDLSRLIREQIALLIKGGGGGQKTLATAGGQDISNYAEVIKTVRNLIQ